MLTRHLAVIPAAVWLAASMVGAADDRSSDGFVSLFNGKDLSGWKVPAGDGGHWKVVDGVIDYDAGSEAKGDKDLWSDREYGDFVLRLDWRLKEAPFVNKSIPYILPDGTHARDIRGKELRLSLPDADSGVFLRGNGDYQVNIWCWPIGSGEMYTVRNDPKTAPDLRAAVTPRTRADKPVGEWNHFEITVKGKTVKVELNGKTVIPGATIPNLPARGRIAFQHHGSRGKDGAWNGPPSLVQFKNIEIKELNWTDGGLGFPSPPRRPRESRRSCNAPTVRTRPIPSASHSADSSPPRERVTWDSASMTLGGTPAARALARPEYRQGRDWGVRSGLEHLAGRSEGER